MEVKKVECTGKCYFVIISIVSVYGMWNIVNCDVKV